jgi:hypothetical protein
MKATGGKLKIKKQEFERLKTSTKTKNDAAISEINKKLKDKEKDISEANENLTNKTEELKNAKTDSNNGKTFGTSIKAYGAEVKKIENEIKGKLPDSRVIIHVEPCKAVCSKCEVVECLSRTQEQIQEAQKTSNSICSLTEW